MTSREIPLRFAKVVLHSEGARTYFPEGFECANWPQPGPEYAELARACGCASPLEYCWEHELLRSLLPEVLWGERGYVVWMAARQRRMSVAAAKAEERLIWYVQRTLGGRPGLPGDLLPVAHRVRELGIRHNGWSELL